LTAPLLEDMADFFIYFIFCANKHSYSILLWFIIFVVKILYNIFGSSDKMH